MRRDFQRKILMYKKKKKLDLTVFFFRRIKRKKYLQRIRHGSGGRIRISQNPYNKTAQLIEQT